jgi:uncharacterized protein (TIGR04255 family)
MMPLDLPAPDKTQLARSPLSLVVCQVRFEEVLAVSDSQMLRVMHEALGGRQGPYPKAGRQTDQGLNIQLGPAGAAASTRQAQNGWRLVSADGSWSVTLMPGHAALETTAYTTWSDGFRPRLERLIEAVATHIAPYTEQRLGLRYVNRIVEPAVTSPRQWEGLIDSTLLGPVLHERLGLGATAAQQQIDLDVGDGVECTFRHGFFIDQANAHVQTYVLDTDVYRNSSGVFDTTDIMTTVDNFNTTALQIFQQCITPRLHASLKGEEKR